MNRAVCVTAALVVLLVAPAAPAQPAPPEAATLRGESTQTRKRLAEAEQKLLSGKAADAVDDLQRILDEAGDDLITLDGMQFRPARWVIHSLFAKLPRDALKAYQDRIDQPAKKLLEQAKRERDPRPLRQLLDRYFVSRAGDEALLLLGDMLFERGEFRAAETTWRRLLPDAGTDLVYPGSQVDPALVRARIVLAVIFQHDTARAKKELMTFKAKHPNANGTLAGKTGLLVGTLQAYLDAPPKLAPEAASGTAWPTYGGGSDRAGRVPGGIPQAWPSRASWAKPDAGLGRPARFPPEHPPFGYPAIINGEVFVPSGMTIHSFDLQTGESSRRRFTPLLFSISPDGRSEANCTLTAAGGLLYARFGSAAVRSPIIPPTGKPQAESILVCLSPTENEERLTELWRLTPPVDEKVPAAWEGAPLVSGRRLWAVYAKFEGGRVSHVAVCYDPADAQTRPVRPAWTAEVCDSPLPSAGQERTRQELLTLAGPNVVFCSNNGAVVALDATTGKRAWGFRYPRSRKAISSATSDPSPPVAYGGCVFVAPVDGERVYALDAATGRLVWESGPTEGARILGVSRNWLVVSVTGPLRSIRGLNLDTGSYRPSEGGWIQSGGGILSYGQGFVTDDVIVWPTRDGLFFLDPTNEGMLSRGAGAPNPLQSPISNYFGHVAYADGVLVVVTPSQVWGYRAQSRKIESKPEVTPRQRFDAMIDRAERELAAGNTPRAGAILAETATSDLPPAFRAWAAARLLQLAPPASDVNQLPVNVRDVLRPAILSEWILPADGVPITLDAFLQRRLGHLLPRGSVPVSANLKPCVPGLSAEAEIDREWKLPPGVAPLRAIAGASSTPKRLFAAGPRALVAIPLDQSAATTYAPADLFTHAASVHTGFVAAGPFAVALYDTMREPLWVFRVPITDRLTDAPVFRLHCDREPAYPHLSSFTLAGTWLLALVGEHHLIALDLDARRVAWVLGTNGRAGYEPNQFPRAVRFGPHFAICGKFVVLQLSDGRRWFVELHTGKPVMRPALGEHTAGAWWPHAPASAGDDRLLLADGPGLVRLVQLGGRVKWAFEPESLEGFTGEPAQVRKFGAGLTVAVRRNHGVELERVELASGKSAWSRGPAFVDADRIDLTAADADSERIYVPSANKLFAFTLTNGKRAWSADLPKGARGWVVHAGKNCLVAYPTEAIPTEPLGAAWVRVTRSFAREPFVWRLPALAGTLYDAWVEGEVPVLLFDAETGKRLARIRVPAWGPTVSAYFDANTAAIATGARVVWLK